MALSSGVAASHLVEVVIHSSNSIENNPKVILEKGEIDKNGLIDGYAVVKVNTKAEAIEWSQRFLAAVGEGESEVRQLREMPA